MNATIVDLRYRMRDVLKALDRGETVTISYRGKEKAQLLPFGAGSPSPKLKTEDAFGLWKDRKELRDIPAYVRTLRRGRTHDL